MGGAEMGDDSKGGAEMGAGCTMMDAEMGTDSKVFSTPSTPCAA
jgi:hypothetical protein